MPLPPQVADLTSFDLLLSVARLGSVGRAAAEHRVSQPAASARLRQLERRLGLTLLHRTTRGSTLTPTGALVADWARAAVDAASALALGVAALRDTHTRRLAVAASQTVAEYLLPAWLVALRAAHPDLSVVLQAANSADVAARVLAGETALGFIEGPDLPSGLHAATVATDSLTVVVAPGHPGPAAAGVSRLPSSPRRRWSPARPAPAPAARWSRRWARPPSRCWSCPRRPRSSTRWRTATPRGAQFPRGDRRPRRRHPGHDSGHGRGPAP